MNRLFFIVIFLLSYNLLIGQVKEAEYEQFYFKSEQKVAPPVFLETILFTALETKIDPIYQPYIDKICQTMLENPELRLVCSSFTDNGMDLKNAVSITQARYNTLVTYFIRRGFEPARLELRQTGKEEPLALGNTAEVKARNNRIEMKFEY